MRIALINPIINSLPEDSFPHLGIGYMAAIAKQEGHQAKIFGLRIKNCAEKKEYLQEDFDLIGITTTSFTFSEACRIAQSVKKKVTVHTQLKCISFLKSKKNDVFRHVYIS